jgi:hypothetical protein
MGFVSARVRFDVLGFVSARVRFDVGAPPCANFLIDA